MMTQELVLPTGAIYERLGLKRGGLVKTRTINIPRLRFAGQVWLRRDKLLEAMKAEYEATEDPILAKFMRVLEEGTA